MTADAVSARKADGETHGQREHERPHSGARALERRECLRVVAGDQPDGAGSGRFVDRNRTLDGRDRDIDVLVACCRRGGQREILDGRLVFCPVVVGRIKREPNCLPCPDVFGRLRFRGPRLRDNDVGKRALQRVCEFERRGKPLIWILRERTSKDGAYGGRIAALDPREPFDGFGAEAAHAARPQQLVQERRQAEDVGEPIP